MAGLGFFCVIVNFLSNAQFPMQSGRAQAQSDGARMID
jgi:hypothetical protein